MKSGSTFLCMLVMMCISAGFVCAQDNPFGQPIRPEVQPPMGMGGGMAPGMPRRDGMEMGMPPREEDLAGMGARCLLKISCDPSVLRLDERMMKHLWFSTGVLNQAYRLVLEDCNNPMGLDTGSGYITLVDSMPGTMTYSVGVSSIGEKEKEILIVAVDKLKSTLSQMADQERHKFLGQLNQTERRCEEMEKQVADMQAQIRDITREGVTHRRDIQEKISDLQNRLREIEMRTQYSKNRIDQLSVQKEKVRSAIEKASASDPITEELKNIVKDREEIVAQLERRFVAGDGSLDKIIQEAKEKMIQSKIEIARRLEEVHQNTGQGQLADIDGKIAAAASDISELSLQEKFMIGELQRTREFLEKSDQIELLEMKLDAARRNFVETLNTRENLKNCLQMQQPLSVTVIGME